MFFRTTLNLIALLCVAFLWSQDVAAQEEQKETSEQNAQKPDPLSEDTVVFPDPLPVQDPNQRIESKRLILPGQNSGAPKGNTKIDRRLSLLKDRVSREVADRRQRIPGGQTKQLSELGLADLTQPKTHKVNATGAIQD